MAELRASMFLIPVCSSGAKSLQVFKIMNNRIESLVFKHLQLVQENKGQ